MGRSRGGQQPEAEQLTIETFRTELTKLKDELRNEIIADLNQLLTAKLSMLTTRIEEQDAEIASLRKCLLESERQRLHTSRQEVASNIVISGLPEDDGETDDTLSNKVASVFDTLDVKDIDIDKCTITRLGRPNGGRRPIKVITPSRAKRDLLLSKAKTLRSNASLQSVYINADRCFLDRKEAARLRSVAKARREEHPNDHVRLSKGKLFINGDEFDRENPLSLLLPGR